MSSNLTDSRTLLEELNTEIATVLIPSMLYCGLLMLVGTAGNTMVVFYYGFKTKTTSATCFILALAVFDLITCVLGIPIEITDMRYFYIFENDAACRVLAFVNHFSVISSAFTLCAIAVDRYKRICKPFDRQMSVKTAKRVSLICAVLGVFFGWPATLLYVVEKVQVARIFEGREVQVTGYDCTSIKDDSYATYWWVFSVTQFVGFLGITTALVVSYFLVGRQLYKHKKFRFYVASKGLRRTASGNMTTMTSQTDYSSDPGLATIPIASIPEEDEEEEYVEVEYEGPDDGPPMMQESIPDLRELLELDANGLPDIETDRPSSAPRNYSHVSRPSSILTNVSVRSRGSIMTVRSVTICDDSENQVFDIEPRDHFGLPPVWSPRSMRSNSTWSNSINNAESVCSFRTISRNTSVTSSLTLANQDLPDIDTEESESNPDFPSTSPRSNSSSLMTQQMFTDKKLKRTRSDGWAENDGVRRNNSNGSMKKPTNGLKRTASEGSGLRRSGSNGSATSRGLRRTGSTESAKLNTDTDPLKDLRMKMLDINTIKYTSIMIVIAVIFVLSCVPYLILAVWRVYSEEDLVYTFTDAQQVWFQIGLRSYFLNCAINPFIYGFFNSQFRAYFRARCCSCFGNRDKITDENDGVDGRTLSSPRSK